MYMYLFVSRPRNSVASVHWPQFMLSISCLHSMINMLAEYVQMCLILHNHLLAHNFLLAKRSDVPDGLTEMYVGFLENFSFAHKQTSRTCFFFLGFQVARTVYRSARIIYIFGCFSLPENKMCL